MSIYIEKKFWYAYKVTKIKKKKRLHWFQGKKEEEGVFRVWDTVK